MDIMDRIKAVEVATETETPFRHVCNMEDPLSSICQLSHALCMIAETFEDYQGMVVAELARTIGEKVRDLGEEYTYLFRLHHPCPPGEGEDWPDERGGNNA